MHDRALPPTAVNDNLPPAEHNRLYNLVAQWTKEQLKLPYPWCHMPEICRKKGYCPRDPNCGE